MRRPKRAGLFLIVFCVVLAVFFGLALALDEDGGFDVTLCLADASLFSADGASLAISARDSQRLLAGPVLRLGIRASRLLAAVSGGLCLLI